MHYKCSSLAAFLNTLRIIVERDSSGKEFHTLEPIKGVDFKPKFEVFLRGITSLLAPHKFSDYYVRRTSCLYISVKRQFQKINSNFE